MAQLTHEQYEIIERAIVDGRRVAIRQPGRRESVLIPLRLRIVDGREAIEARNPVTGFQLTIYLDEIDGVEVVR
jgi:hypothetical protein